MFDPQKRHLNLLSFAFARHKRKYTYPFDIGCNLIDWGFFLGFLLVGRAFRVSIYICSRPENNRLAVGWRIQYQTSGDVHPRDLLVLDVLD